MAEAEAHFDATIGTMPGRHCAAVPPCARCPCGTCRGRRCACRGQAARRPRLGADQGDVLHRHPDPWSGDAQGRPDRRRRAVTGTLHLARSGAVATLRFEQPAKRNAMTRDAAGASEGSAGLRHVFETAFRGEDFPEGYRAFPETRPPAFRARRAPRPGRRSAPLHRDGRRSAPRPAGPPPARVSQSPAAQRCWPGR